MVDLNGRQKRYKKFIFHKKNSIFFSQLYERQKTNKLYKILNNNYTLSSILTVFPINKGINHN